MEVGADSSSACSARQFGARGILSETHELPTELRLLLILRLRLLPETFVVIYYSVDVGGRGLRDPPFEAATQTTVQLSTLR